MDMPEQIGPYRVLRLLGAGGMGEVYLARDAQVRRDVAIKRLVPRSAEQRERFRREAEILGRLGQHAHIVQVHHMLEHHGAMHMVMEYVDGQTLRERIRHGALPVGEGLRLALQIADGMAAAHAEGIIHRDLKSENVLLDRHGTPKITDFGVAKILGDSTLTEDGKSPGTLKAMSPEQIRGKRVTEASDLFSFGILLYETLTGELPFHGAGLDIIESIKRHDPPLLATRIPGLPQALSHLVGMLLQKQPRLRPSSFQDVIDRLKRIEADLDDTTATLTAPEVPAGAPDDESTEDPEALAANVAGPEHAETPVDPGRALIVHPAHGNTGQQRALAESGGAPARSSRRRWLTAVFAAAGVASIVIVVSFRSRDDIVPAHSWPVPAACETNHQRDALGPDSRYIAVLWPDVGKDCPHDAALVRRTLRHGIRQELLMLMGVEVIPDDDITPLKDEQSLRKLAHALDADELLDIRVDCYSDRLSVELQRIDADGRLCGAVEPFDVESSDLGLSSVNLSTGVRTLYAEIARKANAPATGGIPSKEDLERFQRLRQDYWQDHSKISPDAVLQELAQILTRSPDFIEGYIFAAEVEEYRHRVDHDVVHLDRAHELLQKAIELAPVDRAPSSKLLYMRLVSVALGRDDVEAAEAELNALENRDGRSAMSIYLRALVAEERGNVEASRKYLQQAADRHPSWRILYHQARLALDVGDVAAAEQYLGLVFSRSPGNKTALQLYWKLLARTQPTLATALYPFFESTEAHSVLVNQAVRLMNVGRYDEAIDLLLQARAKRPKDVGVLYTLAEAWQLTNRRELATNAFEEALDLLDRTPGAPSDDALRAQTLAHLGRSGEARVAIERALVRNQYVNICYAAAVVYALIEDHAEAIRWTECARDGGYATEWFHYRWFDDIRQTRQLRKRLD